MVNGILQWVAFPLFRGSSRAQDRTQVCRTAGRFFTRWATREKCLKPAHIQLGACNKPVRLSARGNVSVSVNELSSRELLIIAPLRREGVVRCVPLSSPLRASAAAGSERPTSRPGGLPGAARSLLCSGPLWRLLKRKLTTLGLALQNSSKQELPLNHKMEILLSGNLQN